MKKILWFTLQPCGSVRRSGSSVIDGGWLISLEDELKKNKDVDLHVAFFSDDEREPFLYDNVHYYPMLIKKSNHGLRRVLDRYHSIESIDKKMLPVMLNIVRSVAPDLIHIHGTEERFGQIQDHIKNIPIVFSIQGLIAPIENKFFSGMPKADVYKYDSLYTIIRHVGIRNEYNSFVYRGEREKKYLSKAKYILGRTFWDCDVTLGFNPKRKYFVSDEVMRKPFYEKAWNKLSWEKNKFTIISTISGGIIKGFEVVLQTASLLKQYSGIDFNWLIAGYNEKTKWVGIASKITSLNPAMLNIKFLGRLDAEHLSQQLVESDIYVHVSHIENSPNSVCEAMLVGLPVIASFAGGTASLLKNGEEGVLVQDGDPYVLAGAIVDMYQHFDKAKEYGRKARQTALVRHNPKRIADSLIEVYDEIIKEFKQS